MYRLAELSDKRRRMIGASLLILGFLGLALGVIWIHWSSFPTTEVVDGVEVRVELDVLNWWPRGTFWQGLGYLVVLGSTTMALIGAAFLWVLNQPMTWARATFAAFISFVALVFYFGMVPSEWLNFAQTNLNWSSQREALIIPPFLVLGNDVSISFAVIKDSIQMGYSLGMLAVAGILAIQIQKMRQGRPASAAPVEERSPYGRPLLRGGE
ncbi:MAG TPA: hypothetical protein VJ948_13305 [Acidimicrobiia bacterium]|nr:hypothetical protein [Acidimicrobiia bacterium]